MVDGELSEALNVAGLLKTHVRGRSCVRLKSPMSIQARSRRFRPPCRTRHSEVAHVRHSVGKLSSSAFQRCAQVRNRQRFGPPTVGATIRKGCDSRRCATVARGAARPVSRGGATKPAAPRDLRQKNSRWTKCVHDPCITPKAAIHKNKKRGRPSGARPAGPKNRFLHTLFPHISGLTPRLATLDIPLESSRQALSDDVLMSGIVKGLGHQWSVRPSEGVAALSGAGAKPQAWVAWTFAIPPPLWQRAAPHLGAGLCPKKPSWRLGGCGE